MSGVHHPRPMSPPLNPMECGKIYRKKKFKTFFLGSFFFKFFFSFKIAPRSIERGASIELYTTQIKFVSCHSRQITILLNLVLLIYIP